MKKITSIVTGGAGFIGSHLCESLLHKGHNVISIDNLITGNEQNMKGFRNNPNFTFIKQDVLTFVQTFSDIDYIYHLASPASVIDYQSHPKETALVNSLGTMKMLDIARDNNATLLFASTSEIYGNPLEHPQRETYWGNVNPNGVRSCYDESKRFGEMMTFLYHREHKVNARIIRIFNTYGPRMRPTDGRVISNFINQAIRNIPLTVYGKGTQTRSFCYISDLVEGIICAMEHENTEGEVFNLGNPEEFSMIDLAHKILLYTESTVDIVYKPLPKDDPVQRRPDIGKATKTLGWKPTISLQEGLTKTIAYYRSLE